MEAFISSIKFERINDDNCYWKLTIVDKEGNHIGTFGNPLLSDPVNFRKQTFGILSACNCYDLLTLSSKEPKSLSILFEETNHQTVKSISNMSG